MVTENVLILTVGTGNVDELRNTLLTPLIKSIRKGQWGRVLLFPSQLTQSTGEIIRTEIHDLPIEVWPLPNRGQEDDPDACFGHFDGQLEGLRRRGIPPERIVVDFTRGTKAMSAAVVLAALRHGVPLLRYIHGNRDSRGMVIPGTEIVSEFQTTNVYSRQRLDQARQFLLTGQCAAALKLLPKQGEPNWKKLVPLRNLAEFYSAWDRMDHQSASFIVFEKDDLPPDWVSLVPSTEAIEWVECLAQDLPQDLEARANHLVKLAIDLLANAERRLDDGAFQDTTLRCYRLLEFMAHIRLLRCKVNPRSDKSTLHDMIDQLQKLKDPLAREFRNLERKGEVKAEDRNESILVHGFRVVSGQKTTALNTFLRKVQELFKTRDLAGEQAQGWLERARQARPTG